jgi:hypothetical protein
MHSTTYILFIYFFLLRFLLKKIFFLLLLLFHFLLYFVPSSSHVFPLFFFFFIVDAYFVPICGYCMNDQKIGHHFMFLMLILHDMPKRTNKHFMGFIQILQLWTKTSACCWITCKDCMLNPQDLMHILWRLSCKYYNRNHIAHVVFLKNVGITLIALCSLTFYVLCTKVLQYATNS